jgi:hypothetical protein
MGWQAAWMPLQRVALPVTTRLLSRFGQPIVVMHPRSFYDPKLHLFVAPAERTQL